MEQILSQRKAKGLAFSLMFIGFAILAAFGMWWPGILLAVGIPLSIRNFLIGRLYQAFISLVVFVGIFLSEYFEYTYRYFATVAFGLAAVYFFANEFIGPADAEETESEEEEDLNHELEEDQSADK
jgi:hypothetical protein